MRWAARVARMGEKINASRFSSEGLKEGNRLEEPGIDWRIILKLVYNKRGYVNWMFFGE